MSVELEPLLNRLTAFAPHFGRLQGDLEAMVSRGRARDFKGVMQNARLVLEALLRSLVTEELKQTPGKAMLDELITKFRQQANQGVVPTTILAHMGTVQAWGNLSSHDHSGSLTDAGMSVGEEEVLASLNSMLAVLGWFATKRGLVLEGVTRTGMTGSTPALQPAPTAAPAKPSLVPLVAGIGVALVAAIGVAVFLMRGAADTRAEVSPFAGLDALYLSWKEPLPPVGCRRVEDAPKLAAIATDPTALGVVDSNPESAYLLARATWERDKTRHAALDSALACPGFASASNLAGRIALQTKDYDKARKHFVAAIADSPSFLNARFNLALMFLQSRDLAAARDKLDNLIAENPDFGPAYLMRAGIFEVEQNRQAAAADACKAAKLGVEKAVAECERFSRSP